MCPLHFGHDYILVILVPTVLILQGLFLPMLKHGLVPQTSPSELGGCVPPKSD